ncbi:hypothetical protein VQ643_03685 [Pseudomonas sp. F1_0610]|uniref:hypothetical protein n=1 Tax=Pseudomonas sp. F1_0610 TaxID=3114284 RepID=UPI0039C48C66
MLKKMAYGFVFLLVLVGISPLFVYWWALSNLDQLPQPSSIKLSAERELVIWQKEKQTGEPRIESITVYGFVFCLMNQPQCVDRYSGLRLASFAVRNQVAAGVQGKGTWIWHTTWAAYSIWAANNWDIHQILATYDEAYNR